MKYPEMDVKEILIEEGIPTPKVTVTSRSIHIAEVVQNLDLDGDIIKPPKSYELLLKEANKRSKRMNKIANL